MGFSEASQSGSTSSPAHLQARLDCCMRQDGGPITLVATAPAGPYSQVLSFPAPTSELPQPQQMTYPSSHRVTARAASLLSC